MIPPNRYTGWYNTVSLVQTWRHLKLSRIVKVRIRRNSPKLHEINVLGWTTYLNCHLSLRHKYPRAKVLSFNRNYFADGTLIVRVHSKIDCNFHTRAVRVNQRSGLSGTAHGSNTVMREISFKVRIETKR